MAAGTFANTTIPTGVLGDEKYDELIDVYLTPLIQRFREITIYDEPSTLLPDKVTWKQTYGNWNETARIIVVKNGGQVLEDGAVTPDKAKGTFIVNDGFEDGDNFMVTYTFDYFGAEVIKGFLDTAVDIVNSAALGTPASYTITSMPGSWRGVVADLTAAKLMERLILDYALWPGRLIYALTGNQLESGDSSVKDLFDTLKHNFEERAYKSLENEVFKYGNLLSKPTGAYWAAIRTNGGGYSSTYLRGWRPNRLY